MFMLLLGFAFGIPVGIFLGRREAQKVAATVDDPLLPAPATPPPAPAPAAAAIPPPPVAAPPAPPGPFDQPPTPAPPPPPTAAPLLPPPAPLDAPVDPDPFGLTADLPPARASVLPPTPLVPNKRGKRAGLTEDSFRPQDDILSKMQEAWERGDHLRPPADPATPAASVPASSFEDDERTRRVLARLEAGKVGQGADVAQEPAPEAAPGGETLSEAMRQLDAAGYADDLRLDGADLHCGRCGRAHPTADAVVEQVRRFEGPSDPADEAILLGLRCPHCGAMGLLVSSYGPDADPALAEAFTYLASRSQHG